MEYAVNFVYFLPFDSVFVFAPEHWLDASTSFFPVPSRSFFLNNKYQLTNKYLFNGYWLTFNYTEFHLSFYSSSLKNFKELSAADLYFYFPFILANELIYTSKLFIYLLVSILDQLNKTMSRCLWITNSQIFMPFFPSFIQLSKFCSIQNV